MPISTRRKFTVADQRKIPFAALMIPHDIKRQYDHKPGRLAEVTATEFDTDLGEIACITIHFENGWFDEWVVALPLTNNWLDWYGWKLQAGRFLEA